MTTITLEVPDELATRLAPFQDKLPQLLALAVELFPGEAAEAISGGPEPTYPVFKEILEFLVNRPTPEQIVTFKVSPAAQARLEELLDKNREDNLTDEEVAELEIYEQINHFLILLKAHARPLLSSSN